MKKRISSNYAAILDEMQLTLARETLSKCIENVNEIKKKILPGNGNRKQRMSEFLQFILQHQAKANPIELERALKNNGLRKVVGKFSAIFKLILKTSTWIQERSW